MSDKSAIEWTDATWNPVRGCTKVSPGCANCYAETFAERFRGVPGHPYEQGFDLRLVPEKLTEPLSWKKPRRVFVNSMSDLFQEGVPDSFIDQVFAVMAWTPWHTYQVLTKRAERMRDYFAAPWHQRVVRIYIEMRERTPRRELIAVDDARQRAQGWAFGSISCGEHSRRFLPNVWLGVSVENQRFADERIPLLLQTPAAVRFISAEPLLGPLEFSDVSRRSDAVKQLGRRALAGINWVIVGGESGLGARPLNMDWARSVVQQCRAAGVAVFVKQVGAKPFEPYTDGSPFVELHYKSKKGGDPSEWPADLRVREFPAASQVMEVRP